MEVNGFSAVADPPPLQIAEDNVARFSLPQEALNFEPDDLALISKFAGGDQERKIHCNMELRPDELERFNALQAEAKRLGRTYFASITVMATRYISYARGKTDKAIAMMDETQAWRTDYFGKGPLTETSVEEDLSHGVLYFTGRDFALRPVLVIRAERLPDSWARDGSGVTRLIRMLVFCMEYLRRYMFLPGKIENIVVLVDLRNLGIADVPVKALKSIYSVLSHHYIVRVFRFYIVNMSYMLSTLVGVIKPILTDRQRQKLNFLKNTSECREWVALHHLEEDLGGTRPKITKFFPFPLLPGPFSAGYADGPRKDAVENCHRALTPEGFRGRIWDAARTRDENCQYEYTDDAADLFTACGLPIPPNCPIPEPVKEAPKDGGMPKMIVSIDDLQIPAEELDDNGEPKADAMNQATTSGTASQDTTMAAQSMAVNKGISSATTSDIPSNRGSTASEEMTGRGSMEANEGGMMTSPQDSMEVHKGSSEPQPAPEKKENTGKKCCTMM